MTLALIWLFVLLACALFYAWYVGFRAPLTAAEVDAVCAQLPGVDEAKIAKVRAVLAHDDGREFYMANVLKLHRVTASGDSGRRMLNRYQKPFLKAILGRACHPIALGIGFAPAIESWGLEQADDWDFAVFVRYRSRRDLAETLLTPQFHEIHPFKEAALEKTFAFPCAPAHIVGGGPKLMVPLVLICLGLLASLIAI